MITQNRGTIAFAVCGSFCTLEAALQSARALTAQELAKYLASFGKPVTPCDTVADGVRLAIDHAGKAGAVLCYGSLYLLGDVINAVEETK